MVVTNDHISVEVVYALPNKQFLVPLTVEKGTSATVAVKMSGLPERFPGIDLQTARLGVFSRILDGKANPSAEAYILQENDRVEIYRPLIIDPKQARLARAARKS